MSKKVFIVHGWDGSPQDGWFPWLKQELESRGFEVVVPQLPDSAEPRIEKWVAKLAEVVGTPDAQTYFVGHSLGCQTIARFLEGLPEGVVVGGAVFVAGYFKRLSNLEDDEVVRDVAREWLTTPVDLQKVRMHLPKSVAIFSDDDPYVPMDNQDDFRDQLGARVIVEHGRKHFFGSDGVYELPAARDAIADLASLSA